RDPCNERTRSSAARSRAVLRRRAHHRGRPSQAYRYWRTDSFRTLTHALGAVLVEIDRLGFHVLLVTFRARELAQRCAEQLAPPEQLAHHRAQRALHDIRDLFIGEALHVAKDDRGAEISGELRERALDVIGDAALEQSQLGGLLVPSLGLDQDAIGRRLLGG